MSSKATPAVKAWKRKLLDAKKQHGRGMVCIYRQTRLLNEVFRDAEFRADVNLRDDLEAADWLDTEVPSESALGFLQLRSVLEQYPEEKDWEAGKLRAMFASLQPEKPKADRPTHTRKVIKQAEFKAACDERDHFKLRAEQLERKTIEIERKLETYDEIYQDRERMKVHITYLEGRIRELETEQVENHQTIARLEGQVQELEALLEERTSPAVA